MTTGDVKVKQETSGQTKKPINYGLVNLVSDDEDPLAAPMSSTTAAPCSPPLYIECMNMEEFEDEDVFGHGDGADGP